jgi:hypothetical protein
MKGLHKIVTKRLSPCAFGTAHSSFFRQGVHQEAKKLVFTYWAKSVTAQNF